MEAVPAPVYDEVLEFLLSSPTPDQVIAFRPSEAAENRIRELVEKSRAGRLTPEEAAEIEEFDRIEHFVRMLKIKARRKSGR